MDRRPIAPVIFIVLASLAVALASCGLSNSGGDVVIEPTYRHTEVGSVPLLEPPLLADDAATARAQLEAKFGDDVPDGLLSMFDTVDYDRFFVVDEAIGLCSPPQAEDPRLVIDDDGWRIEHSTDIDENVLCDALTRNWLVFVVDREHRALFGP